MSNRASPGMSPRSTAHPWKSSRTINEVLESKDDYLLRRAAGLAGPNSPQPVNPCVLMVKNISGAARIRGDVMQLGAGLLTNFDPLNLWFEADLRAAGGAFCGILLDYTPDDKFGRLQTAGHAVTQVDVLDADHTHAYAKTADEALQSSFGGPFRILAKEPGASGTGNIPCVVEINCFVPDRKVTLDADLAPSSYAAASFFINGVDKGSDNVYFNWMTTGADTIPSGVEGLAKWFDDEQKWVFYQAGCPA